MTARARCEHVDKDTKAHCRKPVAQATKGRTRYCDFHRSDDEVAKRKARIVADSRANAGEDRAAAAELVRHHALEHFLKDLLDQLKECADALTGEEPLTTSRALPLAARLDRSTKTLQAIREELADERELHPRW